MENKTCFEIPTELLDEVINLIEEKEEQIEGEWGTCRKIIELISSGSMPDPYYKLVAIRNSRQPT